MVLDGKRDSQLDTSERLCYDKDRERRLSGTYKRCFFFSLFLDSLDGQREREREREREEQWSKGTARLYWPRLAEDSQT